MVCASSMARRSEAGGRSGAASRQAVSAATSFSLERVPTTAMIPSPRTRPEPIAKGHVAPSNPTRKKQNTLLTTIAEPRPCRARICLLLGLASGPPESRTAPFCDLGDEHRRLWIGRDAVLIVAGRLRS